MTRPDPIRRTPVRLAWLALLWERSAPVLAAPFLALGVYLALALFGVFERTGDPVRLLALLAALIAAGAALRFTLPRFAAPTWREAERRVELDSAIAGRPYEALRDAPAGGDAELWAAHRARMGARLSGARARRPRAAWARFDAYGARVSLIVVLIAGAFLAGDLALLRVSDAFAPRALAGGGAEASVEFWVEPPAYTGRPVIYLRERRSVEAPEGSLIAARVTGLARDPAVSGAPAEIETLSHDVRQVMLRPTQSGEIVLRSGVLRERLAVTLIEDAAPEVRLASEPEGDAQGRLILEFAAEDDYGVEQFVLEYAAAPGAPLAPFPDDYTDRPLSPGEVGAPDKDGFRTATIDVARSPLAGERVVIRMAALDGAGRRGVSGPMEITLPERVFLDPLAKAVADERRRFVTAQGGGYAPMPEGVSTAVVTGGFLTDEPDRRIERAPARVQRLALALDAFSDAPPAYFDDVVVWMGLRAALNETRRAREIEQLSHLDEDLWQIALRAELGSLADAEAALRAAERALQDALARGADAMELSALMDAYEQAVSRYMQLLAREAAEEGRFAEGGGGMGGLGADALQELIDALREAAELGDSEGSREALARLQQLLENLQLTLTQGGGEGGQGQESAIAQALREALEELGETIGEQRSVMEDTFNQQQGDGQPGEQSGEGAPGEAREGGGEPTQGDGGEAGAFQQGEPEAGAGGPPGADGDQAGNQGGEERGEGAGGLAERQQALAEGLEGLAGQLPGGEDGAAGRAALEAAREAMEAARRALEAGDAEAALGAQDEALEALREAARDASERYESARAGEPGRSDPLGRQGGGAGAGGPGTETGVPSEAERQRARDILEELRRRAAERGRPQEELDYIDRLLERF
ncbi:MAG: DUF4175 domain-containing protein [Oceanicaulis sp.]